MRENSLMIRVENVKKQYRLGQIGGGTLRGDLQSWWARVRGKEDPNTVIGTDQRLIGTTFMALNGVSFTVKEEICTPKGDAVNHYYLIIYVVPAEIFFLFNVCPLFTSSFLMFSYSFLEFVVPYVSRGKIYRIVREAQSKFLCIYAFTRALSAGNKNNLFHIMQR